jgi:hypothetical protein
VVREDLRRSEFGGMLIEKGPTVGITMNFKRLLGGLAICLAIAAFVSALPDMKKYIRISTM